MVWGRFGQVSVEFGLLWGWVLLLVLLLVGGLVYFGLFEGGGVVLVEEFCELGGVVGCSDFGVFEECLVFDLENLVGRGLVVEDVSVVSGSLRGECSFVLGQSGVGLVGGVGVLGVGERGTFVLVEGVGEDCFFVDDGVGGG